MLLYYQSKWSILSRSNARSTIWRTSKNCQKPWKSTILSQWFAWNRLRIRMIKQYHRLRRLLWKTASSKCLCTATDVRWHIRAWENSSQPTTFWNSHRQMYSYEELWKDHTVAWRHFYQNKNASPPSPIIISFSLDISLPSSIVAPASLRQEILHNWLKQPNIPLPPQAESEKNKKKETKKRIARSRFPLHEPMDDFLI